MHSAYTQCCNLRYVNNFNSSSIEGHSKLSPNSCKSGICAYSSRINTSIQYIPKPRDKAYKTGPFLISEFVISAHFILLSQVTDLRKLGTCMHPKHQTASMKKQNTSHSQTTSGLYFVFTSASQSTS